MESAGTVAIVGRPNVGKSALFNRLVGRNIAIVHDQPGITRDRIAAMSTRGARPFLLWDTGGVGGAGEGELPTQVRAAAEAAIRESDLILFVVDAQQGLTPVDADLARRLRKSAKPVLLVVNKIDDPKHEALEADFAGLKLDPIAVSAAHGRGIQHLLEEIGARLAQQTSNVQRPTSNAQLAIAVVGKPNAGKSSLINAILRDERTIVSEIAGTTRDAIDIRYTRGRDQFVLIDTAGIRSRSKHSSSVEVFSVMRAERSIRRADLCVLVVDLTSGVTSQDKKIAGLIQKAQKACVVLLNKSDLVQMRGDRRGAIRQLASAARDQLFFLPYAPVLVTSAVTRDVGNDLFGSIKKIRSAARHRFGTGALNRLLRSAMTENPPPMVGTRRLKLFYATDATDERELAPRTLALFVNDPKLLTDTYARFLEGRIRAVEPYPGLPIQLSCRARSESH